MKMKKLLVFLSIMTLAVGLEAASGKAQIRKARNSSTKTSKVAKKKMKTERDDLYESLEEKVFRAKSGQKAKFQATEDAFAVGKKRMYYLQQEEDAIREMEDELSIVDADHEFLTEKYDNVMNQFTDVKTEIDALTLENKKLKDYLAKLNEMEKRVKVTSK